MKSEVRIVASLSLLYVVRMLGLFMVLPVLFLYGDQYADSSAATLGFALGVYGLTQAVFQVPLGMLSDFLGRKPVIVLGLILFAVGSVVAATSDTVYGLIVGRALQGSGAIAATVMALLADLTSYENRSKAMAAIGASIGVSFTLSLILGPLIAAHWGLSGIFWMSFVLTLLGLVVLLFGVPSVRGLSVSSKSDAAGSSSKMPVGAGGAIAAVLSDLDLLRLNFGIFALHATLTAMFVVVPGALMGFGLDRADHGQVYLPVMLVSFLIAVPLMMRMEKKGRAKEAFSGAVFALMVALYLLSVGNSVAVFALILFLFFIAFNLLEAMLPSQVSKFAPAKSRGTAMGVYSTAQFLGAFAGGTAGGIIVSVFGTEALLYACAGLCGLWFVVSLGMSRVRQLQSVSFEVSSDIVDADLLAQTGVEEAVYVAEDGIVYLKIDSNLTDLAALNRLVAPYRAVKGDSALI